MRATRRWDVGRASGVRLWVWGGWGRTRSKKYRRNWFMVSYADIMAGSTARGRPWATPGLFSSNAIEGHHTTSVTQTHTPRRRGAYLSVPACFGYGRWPCSTTRQKSCRTCAEATGPRTTQTPADRLRRPSRVDPPRLAPPAAGSVIAPTCPCPRTHARSVHVRNSHGTVHQRRSLTRSQGTVGPCIGTIYAHRIGHRIRRGMRTTSHISKRRGAGKEVGRRCCGLPGWHRAAARRGN